MSSKKGMRRRRKGWQRRSNKGKSTDRIRSAFEKGRMQSFFRARSKQWRANITSIVPEVDE